MQKGFTLLEVLLVVALIAGLAGLSVPVYNTFYTGNELDTAGSITIQSIRRAQVLTLSGKEDANWGVKLEEGKITVFKGDSFVARDNSFDEVFDVSNIVDFSGIEEIVFNKVDGRPNSSGTIDMSTQSGQNINLTINQLGSISYS